MLICIPYTYFHFIFYIFIMFTAIHMFCQLTIQLTHLHRTNKNFNTKYHKMSSSHVHFISRRVYTINVANYLIIEFLSFDSVNGKIFVTTTIFEFKFVLWKLNSCWKLNRFINNSFVFVLFSLKISVVHNCKKKKIMPCKPRNRKMLRVFSFKEPQNGIKPFKFTIFQTIAI